MKTLSIHTRITFTALCAFMLLSAAGPSSAQDYERVAPKTPVTTKKPATVPAAPSTDISGDQMVVKKLTGVVFVSSKAAVQKTAVSATGVQTKGIALIDNPAFIARIEPYLGKAMTKRDLGQMVREVVLYCREQDHPVVNVVVPAQDVTGGAIQVVLMEGTVGEVRAQGNKWFDSKLLEGTVKLRPGDHVESESLLRDINRLNSNPFRTVDVAFTPGKKEGEVDLELKTQDRFPVRFFTGYEDTGNDGTGDERLLTGFNWGNAFGLDHQMNYQFMGDGKFNKVTVHSGSYLIPMPWGDRLTFFGFYQSAKPDTDLTPAIDVRSQSWQSSVRYNHTLPGFGAYVHEAVVGFDFKQTVNNLRVGNGLLGFNQSSDVAQWTLGYNSGYRDDWGRTGFGGNLFYSPGDIGRYNNDTRFREQRAFSGADYYYAKLTLERVTELPWEFTWVGRGTLQVSPNGNLLPSEQLAFGGYQSIRGYDERLVGGDEGVILTHELWTPAVSFGSWCGIQNARDRFQFLGFVDYGVAENKTLLIGEDPSVVMLGAGPGLRYSISPYMSVRADYGFQLKDVIESGFPSRHNSRWHVGLVVSY